MRTSPVSYHFRRFIQDRIELDATDVIRKVAPVISLDALYDAFGVSPDDKETLLKADERAWYRHHNTYKVQLRGFGTIREVPVEIKAPLPRQYGYITAGSELAPTFKFTQEWSILHYITSEVIQYVSRTAVAGVFPWLPDVVREEEYNYEKDAKNRNFHAKYSIRQSEDKRKFHSCMIALTLPPKNIPVVPTVAREAIALGNKLYTQFRLLKDRPIRNVMEGMIRVETKLSDDYVPQHIKDAVEEMKDFQNTLRFQNAWD
jgi:hypothetical protein